MDINNRYNEWLNHPNIDEESKKVLLNMSEKESNDCFYTDVHLEQLVCVV